MKKITNNKLRMRAGGAFLILVLLVMALLFAAGVAVYNGSQQQKRQAEILAQGYQLFNEGKFSAAYEQFKSAKHTFSATLNLYRQLKKSDTHVTPADLNELTVSTCLSAAYEDFFELNSSEEWLGKAENDLKHHEPGLRKDELSQTLTTARSVSKLCQDFKAGDVEKAMKGLLEAEKNALPTDQDFFIFEIRMLIACGKALNDVDVINQARELLFFATTDAGINNDKTGKLWVLLTN